MKNEEKKEGKKSRIKKKNKKVRRFLGIQVLLQFVAIFGILYVLYADDVKALLDEVKQLKEEAVLLVADVAEGDFRPPQSGVAYAEGGTIISMWRGSRNVYYVPLYSMPQEVIDAMVSVEDRNYYRHSGVDYKALLRALYALVKNRGRVTQGGSTITMQLARTMYLSQEISWRRKVKEIFIAMELEKTFSKEQIMEFYLNNIYFGNGYYGIGTASRGYFGKNVWELDLEQIAFLCAIPNNPTIYDPLTHIDNTNKRKSLILKCMAEQGFISEEDCEAAKDVTIALSETAALEKSDYVGTYVTYCAVQVLMEMQGFEFRSEFASEADKKRYRDAYNECYAQCQQLLYTEGYRFYTSIDLDMQKQLQSSVDAVLSTFTDTNESGVYLFQGAAVCIDNTTGLVRAIVGGRSQEFDFYPLNRAYQSFRQPGSCIKPLIVYTPQFERGYTPDTIVVDRPIEDGPKNASGRYAGNITVRYAVEQSINTVAWQLFEELTPEVGLSYLTRMNFSQIVGKDYALPAALGGLTIGVSPMEMAAAYAAIYNGGVFRNPTCIVRILDAEGNQVYAADSAGEQVYTPEAAATMNEVLVSVMENGTAKPINMTDRFCAGKTGTTDDCKDSWFVGYTEDYTTSVWVGYDMPTKIEGLGGPAYSGFIWRKFMDEVYGAE